MFYPSDAFDKLDHSNSRIWDVSPTKEKKTLSPMSTAENVLTFPMPGI